MLGKTLLDDASSFDDLCVFKALIESGIFF